MSHLNSIPPYDGNPWRSGPILPDQNGKIWQNDQHGIVLGPNGHGTPMGQPRRRYLPPATLLDFPARCRYQRWAAGKGVCGQLTVRSARFADLSPEGPDASSGTYSWISRSVLDIVPAVSSERLALQSGAAGTELAAMAVRYRRIRRPQAELDIHRSTRPARGRRWRVISARSGAGRPSPGQWGIGLVRPIPGRVFASQCTGWP